MLRNADASSLRKPACYVCLKDWHENIPVKPVPRGMNLQEKQFAKFKGYPVRKYGAQDTVKSQMSGLIPLRPIEMSYWLPTAISTVSSTLTNLISPSTSCTLPLCLTHCVYNNACPNF